MAPLFEELRNSIKGVVDYRETVLRSAEQEIFELAVLISKKVLCTELQTRPEIILEVVRRALQRAVGWGKATVQVNPEDFAFLEEHRLLLNEEGEGVTLVRVEANPSIKRGGCVLESNFGEIDARLEKQVDAVEAALREALAIKETTSSENGVGNPDASMRDEDGSLRHPPVEGVQQDDSPPEVATYQLKELEEREEGSEPS